MLADQATPTVARSIGRYVLFEQLAAGGMATVHIGRLRSTAGFKRTVAIKRLHAEYARDPEFVSSFLDEAQLAARIQHPNVVPVLDVVAEAGELFMVMEYVHGESLSSLLKAARRKGEPPRPAIVGQIITGLLYGLHAAHEAKSDRGIPLEIVHRDVSPQNVLVGVDGVARVLDFGVAKAAQQVRETTKEGVVKGKVAYMPPEQLEGTPGTDRRIDIYAAGVVLWETLTGRRLHEGELGAIVARILTEDAPPPSSVVPLLPAGLDAIVAKALARDRDHRYATALEMAHEIEKVLPPIAAREVGEWVKSVADERLRQRADIVSKTEKISLPPPPGGRTSIHDIISDGQRASHTEIGLGPAPSMRDETTETAANTPSGQNISSLQALPDAPARASKRARWLIPLVGGAIACGVFAVLAVVLVPGRGSSAAHDAAVHSAPSTATEPLPAIAMGEDAGNTSAASSIEIADTPPSPAPGAASSVAVVVGPHTSVAPAMAPTTSTSRPVVRRKCDPPWTVDARGVRVIKRECL